MNIDRIHEYLPPQQMPLKGQKGEAASKSRQTDRRDKIDLSPEARQLKEKDLVAVAKAALDKIPDIRQQKVNEVRGKIARHYYDDERVVRDIAGKMARSEELREALAGENREAAKADPAELKKLAVVFNRMDRKFYDSDEVLGKVARNILNDLKQNGQI